MTHHYFKKGVTGLFFILNFLGCHQKDKKDSMLYKCDVDSFIGWYDSNHISKFSGHTGNYSCLLDSAFPFSIGFKRRVDEISEKDLLRAQVTAWVYPTSEEAKGTIVCAIDSVPGKTYIYLADGFDDKIKKPGAWTMVTSVFYFPRNIKKNAVLSSYVWNTGKQEMYVDDITIKFTEY